MEFLEKQEIDFWTPQHWSTNSKIGQIQYRLFSYEIHTDVKQGRAEYQTHKLITLLF